jgi:dTDP-4-dehydrorhamnose 3,5-epimerase-like enzyme
MKDMPDANDLRGLAKHLNSSSVELIEQVLQKHTAAILYVVREQTHELQSEREKMRVLRVVVSRMYHNECESRSEWDDMAEAALQATAQEEE